MKKFLILIPLLAAACGGSLSDEQRKKMRENMEAGEIKKVTDAQLTEASFAYGRTIATLIEKKDKSLTNKKLLDSLASAYSVKIISLSPGDSMAQEVENQIIEAYTAGAGQVELADNVQNLNNDSIFYTKPILRERPDGSVEFTKALGIRMPVRTVVLSIKD